MASQFFPDKRRVIQRCNIQFNRNFPKDNAYFHVPFPNMKKQQTVGSVSGYLLFYTELFCYSTTPSLKMEISRKPFSSAFVCFPEATASTCAIKS